MSESNKTFSKNKAPNWLLLITTFLTVTLGTFSAPVLSAGNQEIRINVPSRTLSLMQGGRVVKEYSVGVGNSKTLMTPPGSYKIEKKIINPIWEHPYKAEGQVRIGEGSKNPLGTRWIGFYSKGDGVFGIHGTNEPSSVGHFVSHGCVRMLNNEVEELFEIVQVGTPVTVTYERFRLSQEGNSLLLEIFPDPYGYKQLSEVEIVNSILRFDPNAQIDYEMISQAIKENSEKSLYEVAAVSRLMNFTQNYPQMPFSFPFPPANRMTYAPFANPQFIPNYQLNYPLAATYGYYTNPTVGSWGARPYY